MIAINVLASIHFLDIFADLHILNICISGWQPFNIATDEEILRVCVHVPSNRNVQMRNIRRQKNAANDIQAISLSLMRRWFGKTKKGGQHMYKNKSNKKRGKNMISVIIAAAAVCLPHLHLRRLVFVAVAGVHREFCNN